MAIEVNRLYLFGSLAHKEDATTALEPPSSGSPLRF
jgi:hypothetical protein